jgi:hypothetical protein
MANTLRFKRGLASGIPTALAGEPLFTTDTFDLYIGNGTTNTRFQKYIASGTTSQLLRGDGSLLTMPIVLTSPANGQVLKFNGTNWVNDSDAGITGSGAAGQVAYFTGATTQAGNNNLFWDNTNARLGIGTNAPARTLDVQNAGLNILRLKGGSATNQGSSIYITEAASTNTMFAIGDASSIIGGTPDANSLIWTRTSPLLIHIASAERARFFATGNFGIGTGATDSGQRLQVVGTGYFSDSVGIGTSSLTGFSARIGRNISGATNSGGVWQDGTVQSTVTNGFGFYNSARTQATAFTLSNYYHYYADQFSLGAGSSVTNQFGYVADSTLTGATNNYGFYGNIAAATGRWNLYMNGTANNYMAGNLGVGDALTLAAWTKAIYLGNNGANKVIAGYLASSTNGAAIGSMGSALTGWTPLNIIGSTLLFHTNGEGVKMTLDASGNLMVATTSASNSASGRGNITIGGSSTSILNFQIGGTLTGYFYHDNNNLNLLNSKTGGSLLFSTESAERARVTQLGNLHIGTFSSDSGEKLQVTGTAKITGATAFGGNTTLTGAGLMTHTIVSTSTAGYSYMIFKNTGASGREMTLGIGGSTTGNDSNKFFIGDTTAGGAIRMIIDTSGNIGFGTYNPDARLRVVSASANSTQAIFGNVDGRGLLIATSQIAGTNDAGTILNARGASSGTFIFQTDGTQRMQLDVNGLEFPNNKGLLFDNASASAVGSIKMGTGVTNPLEITNGTHTVTLATLGTFISSNLLVGASTIGTSATNTIAVVNGTAPSSSATDIFHLYSADVTAGNAAPHFRTENGAVIKLYQETTAVGNSIFSQGGGNAVLDDSTFAGYTIRQVVQALRNQGILQ